MPKNGIVAIDSEIVVVLIYHLNPFTLYIDIIVNGKVKDRIDLHSIEDYKQDHKAIIFGYKNGFGLIHYDNNQHQYEYIYLWETIDNLYKKVKIINPFPTDEFGWIAHPIQGSYMENNSIVFSLKAYRHFMAQYWSILQIADNFSSATWVTKLNELDLNLFPETYTKKNTGSDWLSIIAISYINDKIHIQSNGGDRSRSKTGPAFEFNIISVYDMKGNPIRSVQIENGTGNYSSSKEYLIVRKEEDKNKLIFYKTMDYSYEELSLTSKQNLGNIKLSVHDQIKTDSFLSKVWIYSRRFLHECEMVF